MAGVGDRKGLDRRAELVGQLLERGRSAAVDERRDDALMDEVIT